MEHREDDLQHALNLSSSHREAVVEEQDAEVTSFGTKGLAEHLPGGMEGHGEFDQHPWEPTEGERDAESHQE